MLMYTIEGERAMRAQACLKTLRIALDILVLRADAATNYATERALLTAAADIEQAVMADIEAQKAAE